MFNNTDVIIVVVQTCFGITGQILGQWDVGHEDFSALYFELDYLRYQFEVKYRRLSTEYSYLHLETPRNSRNAWTIFSVPGLGCSM